MRKKKKNEDHFCKDLFGQKNPLLNKFENIAKDTPELDSKSRKKMVKKLEKREDINLKDNLSSLNKNYDKLFNIANQIGNINQKLDNGEC